jgi:acyl-CoA hydrolase
MDTYCFVRPEHLNHHNFLFGGQLLKWVDEYTWLAAALEYPGCVLVTRAMDKISFAKRVCSGAILRFNIEWKSQRHTSVTYNTKVFAKELGIDKEQMVFSTNVTFVCINEKNEKQILPQRECKQQDKG